MGLGDASGRGSHPQIGRWRSPPTSQCRDRDMQGSDVVMGRNGRVRVIYRPWWHRPSHLYWPRLRRPSCPGQGGSDQIPFGIHTPARQSDLNPPHQLLKSLVANIWCRPFVLAEKWTSHTVARSARKAGKIPPISWQSSARSSALSLANHSKPRLSCFSIRASTGWPIS